MFVEGCQLSVAL